MLTTIASASFPWQHGGSAAVLRIYAEASYVTTEGAAVTRSEHPSENVFKSVNCTINVGVLAVPQIVIESAADLDNNVYLTVVLLDESGVQRPFIVYRFLLPEEENTNWGEIFGANDVTPAPPVPPDYVEDILDDPRLIELIDERVQQLLGNYYTKTEIDALLENIEGADLSNYYTKSQSDTRYAPIGGGGSGGAKSLDGDVRGEPSSNRLAKIHHRFLEEIPYPAGGIDDDFNGARPNQAYDTNKWDVYGFDSDGNKNSLEAQANRARFDITEFTEATNGKEPRGKLRVKKRDGEGYNAQTGLYSSALVVESKQTFPFDNLKIETWFENYTQIAPVGGQQTEFVFGAYRADSSHQLLQSQAFFIQHHLSTRTQARCGFDLLTTNPFVPHPDRTLVDEPISSGDDLYINRLQSRGGQLYWDIGGERGGWENVHSFAKPAGTDAVECVVRYYLFVPYEDEFVIDIHYISSNVLVGDTFPDNSMLIWSAEEKSFVWMTSDDILEL